MQYTRKSLQLKHREPVGRAITSCAFFWLPIRFWLLSNWCNVQLWLIESMLFIVHILPLDPNLHHLHLWDHTHTLSRNKLNYWPNVATCVCVCVCHWIIIFAYYINHHMLSTFSICCIYKKEGEWERKRKVKLRPDLEWISTELLFLFNIVIIFWFSYLNCELIWSSVWIHKNAWISNEHS